MAVPSVQEIAQGSVAQLVERSTENREVTGSTPVGATVPFPGFYWERDFFLPVFGRLFDSQVRRLPTVCPLLCLGLLW